MGQRLSRAYSFSGAESESLPSFTNVGPGPASPGSVERGGRGTPPQRSSPHCTPDNSPRSSRNGTPERKRSSPRGTPPRTNKQASVESPKSVWPTSEPATPAPERSVSMDIMPSPPASKGPERDLFDAAEAGDSARLSTLLSASVAPDVNWRGVKGRTALLAAARGGYEDCMLLLLRAGAVPNVCNDVGVTPLHMAAYGGHLECVRQLIDYGAETVARDHAGKSALEYAGGGKNAPVRDMLKFLQPAPDCCSATRDCPSKSVPNEVELGSIV